MLIIAQQVAAVSNIERFYMEIVRNIKVPTGNILIVQGDRGKLECLSLGDYGKEHNIKADFLGLTRDFDKDANNNIIDINQLDLNSCDDIELWIYEQKL